MYLCIAPVAARTCSFQDNFLKIVVRTFGQGLCDNLVTSVFRAWDFSVPVVVAPAMNTLMWENSFTKVHLDAVEKLGVAVVPPMTKLLACGDVGNGAMATPEDISEVCKRLLELS